MTHGQVFTATRKHRPAQRFFHYSHQDEDFVYCTETITTWNEVKRKLHLHKNHWTFNEALDRLEQAEESKGTGE